jgi:hypothetical protein
MRISHAPGQHLIVLSNEEARILMQICALVVTATSADSRIKLPAAMLTVLCQLFSGLQRSDKESTSAQS